MRQAQFVNSNEEKWKEFEFKINSNRLSADDLSYIYVHLTEDLAYAKARFSDTKVFQYLNELTLKAHNLIYRNKPQKKSRFVTFWSREIPLELKKSYPYLGYSFFIFIVGVLIGALSAAYDDTFARLILGDGYVNMTLENIRSGKPMAVYESINESEMFVTITLNNIRVSFFAFAAGLLLSVGTGYVLLSNGIMLGVFHYLFFSEGVFNDHIITVWIHGTLEICAIIIAGGAGIIMGNGILFPGNFPRAYSFRLAARRGVKIIISLIPFFLVAGFIESFITRNTHWPLYVKIFIVSISLFVVLTYLLILPNLSKHEPGKDRTL